MVRGFESQWFPQNDLSRCLPFMTHLVCIRGIFPLSLSFFFFPSVMGSFRSKQVQWDDCHFIMSLLFYLFLLSFPLKVLYKDYVVIRSNCWSLALHLHSSAFVFSLFFFYEWTNEGLIVRDCFCFFLLMNLLTLDFYVWELLSFLSVSQEKFFNSVSDDFPSSIKKCLMKVKRQNDMTIYSIIIGSIVTHWVVLVCRSISFSFNPWISSI